MDQLQTDYQLRAVLADVQDLIAGVEYTLYGQKYKYMGTDLIHKQSMVLMRDHPEMFNAQVALGMMRDPIGYRPPPFQLSPNVVAGVAAAAAVGKLADLAGMGDAVSNIAPGLSAAVEGLKDTIKGVTDKLPIKALGAGGIAIQGEIAKVKLALNAALKGPTSAISMAMKGSLLADVAKAAEAAAGAAGAAVSLASSAAGLAKAMSSGNPVAIASAAAGMASKFPMINPNAIAGQMAAGALSGAGFDIASKIPNISALPGGIMKMMPVPGKVPTKDAKSPVKTAAPPKPVKPVEMKNLFAEGAAAGGISDLMKPLSQAMGIASTIASAAGVVNMLTHSPAATSFGRQKLTGNANTVNWSSGGYQTLSAADVYAYRRMKLSSQIERHTKELDSMCVGPYNILYSMPYPQLIQKYPRIKPNTPVAQALQIIASVEAGLAIGGAVASLFDGGNTASFESGGIIDSGAAASSTGTTPALLDDAYASLRDPTLQDRTNPATFRGASYPTLRDPTNPATFRGAQLPNPQEQFDSSGPQLPNAMSGYDYNQQGNNDVSGLNELKDWNDDIEKKVTEEAIAGPNLPDPNQGYDYGQQDSGDNSVGSDYG